MKVIKYDGGYEAGEISNWSGVERRAWYQLFIIFYRFWKFCISQLSANGEILQCAMIVLDA